MSVQDDDTTLKLRVVYEANQAITQAISEIRRLKEETGGLSVENQKTLQTLEYQKTLLDGVGSELDKHTAKVHEDALAQRAMRRALEESEPVHKALETRVQSTATAHGNMGRGVLQASYAVQDFTSVLSGGGGFSRALGSVQNNIPVLLSGLGMSAGLAGAISLVSVGFGAAIPLLSSFIDMEDKAAEATKKHAEEAQKLKDALTSEQEETKKKVDSYTKDNNKTTAQAIETALKLEARGRPITEADMGAALAEMPATFGEVPGAREGRAREAIIARRDERAQEEANRLVSTLNVDPSARAQAAQLARTHKGFPAGFVEAMEHPDDIETQKDRDKKADALTEQGRELEKKTMAEKQKAIDDQDKLAEQLTREGLAAQKQTFQERDDEAEKEKLQKAAETRHLAAQRYAEEQRLEHEQRAAQVLAERNAAQAAHDADPRIANRHAIQAEQSQALQAVQQNTHGFNAPQQHEIARHLQQSYDAGFGMSHTFSEMLGHAIRQMQQEYDRGVQAGLHRQQQTSQSFYQPQ